MNINIKKLYEDSQIPTRGSEKAAGYDLRASLTGTMDLNDSSCIGDPGRREDRTARNNALPFSHIYRG